MTPLNCCGSFLLLWLLVICSPSSLLWPFFSVVATGYMWPFSSVVASLRCCGPIFVLWPLVICGPSSMLRPLFKVMNPLCLKLWPLYIVQYPLWPLCLLLLPQSLLLWPLFTGDEVDRDTLWSAQSVHLNTNHNRGWTAPNVPTQRFRKNISSLSKKSYR